jgi:G3E family GTPase
VAVYKDNEGRIINGLTHLGVRMDSWKSRAAIIGGVSEKTRNVLLANALRKISIADPHSNVLVIRDHVEMVPGIDEMDEPPQVAVEYLSGGCFCCTLKSAFESLLKGYASRSGVWHFLIESPLIADVGAIEASIKRILGKNLRIEKAFAIDAETIDVLLETFPNLFNRNINQADVLAISTPHDIKKITRLKGAPQQLKDRRKWHDVKIIESMGLDVTLFVREGNRLRFFFDWDIECPMQ